MYKDENKTIGKFTLESRTLPLFWREIVRILGYLDMNTLAARLAKQYGKLNWQTSADNLGMNARLAVVAGLYGGTGAQTAFSYLAVGTSSTAVAASQTTLVAEITDTGLGRAAATMSRTTTTQTNDTTVFSKTWTATGSKTIEEIGYFNASSAGVMGGRALTGTKSLVSGNTLTATYSVIHS